MFGEVDFRNLVLEILSTKRRTKINLFKWRN